MQARRRENQRERWGIVLVLILAVLGLMAVIGITFATFSGQSRISARNFAQSVNQPQRDELMDYALSQLICDTPDIRSSIRGHSMARDMFGNDASHNGYVAANSDGTPLQITNATNVSGTLYNLTTNIVVGDPAFYGYNFTRWTLRVRMVTGYTNTGVVDQSLEVLNDITTGANRVFTVNINPTDSSTSLITPPSPGYPSGFHTDLPGQYLIAGTGTYQFVLDGRWLHAFNGPGMTASAVQGNFRYNGLRPDTTGMDEDYDAVDLENWFLAMQSADGQVMIPSFHRPAAIRIDSANTTDDWSRDPAWTWDRSRILRPVAADGHDATTFADLRPDATGRLQYDVDNDGDGQTDSVWVDLGYPVRRNAQGQLYKPLFSFMVIGLNGRIPLNTAGNLAGQGATHAAHLGNSVSEVDPTYALQNAFAPAYSQTDNAGQDVRLTQLRNLLAGTRTFDSDYNPGSPPYAPTPVPSATNGDANWVAVGLDALGNPFPFWMPNGVIDANDVDTTGAIPPASGQVARFTAAVPGRWGEAQSVPGYPIPTGAGPVNFVEAQYRNRIRAGYSMDVGDIVAGQPRDAADDNYNSFDPYPTVGGRLGEVGDLDFLDPAGAILLPVERMRRYLAPADVNGTGRILQWDGIAGGPGPDHGGDSWGRVEYSSYFRPPGLPGQVELGGAPNPGAVLYPWAATTNYPSDMVTPNVTNNNSHDNNPLHGFESFRFPNLNYPAPSVPPGFSPQRVGGVPIDLPAGTPPPYPILPTTLPTYDEKANAHINSDGLNEADEMNLYLPNARLDSPFGYGDLEWLYRQQDVDGSSLTSRLAKLAPISFRNPAPGGDAQRRRRLFALDSWDLNSFSWANDNPGNVFPNNSRFTFNLVTPPPYPQDASFLQLGLNQLPPNPQLAAPTIVHRDKKINLNYPLPVSNDPNEPVRQKWIIDAYYTLKTILPPKAVDTPEELAQLSQFVINIIDFRDPDATMTHWINPDVSLAVWNGTGTIPVSPVLIAKGAALPANTVLSNTAGAFHQYGMEFNPIAINEVLAYSFLRKDPGGNATATPRFFIELANTLTSPETGTATNNASILDLSGLLSNGSPATAPQTPWDNACWDIIFTDDRANNRPDPYLGQLQPPTPSILASTNYGVYGLLPLSQNAMVTSATPPPAPLTPDVYVLPLPQAPVSPGPPPPTQPVPFGQYYFTVIGNNILDFPSFAPAPTESSAPVLNAPNGFTIQNAWDPVDFNVTTSPLPATMTLPAGALPPQTTDVVNTTYPKTLQTGTPPAPAPLTSKVGQFFWVCLRRPANPFAPVSATNPMVVVDSMRFPYIEGGGTVDATGNPVLTGANQIYSYQRLQPYRGGHAVPVPGGGTVIDTRYGFTEQVAGTLAGSDSGNYGNYGGSGAITNHLLHTLGLPNEGAFANPRSANPTPQEQWDYFPFNDRDFTSVAELTLVPGCPPGLFTKQFAEFSPTAANVTTYFKPAVTANLITPYLPGPPTVVSGTAVDYFTIGGATNPIVPHTFPYLVDKFFYSGYGGPVAPATAPPADPGGVVGGYGADGWFKMLEFFEVPSQSMGAIGPVAQGMNFDWARQNAKPGLINLNLIVDEEVFFSVFGKQNQNFNQQLMNFAQLPDLGPAYHGGSLAAGTLPLPLPAGNPPIPWVVTATTASGAPAAAYPMHNVGVVALDPLTGGIRNWMKVSFAQFLSLRHGGSGFVFGYGSGLPGQNTTVLTTPANPNAPAFATSPIPAERPFHSLSYPDIDYTIMRPAALPPATYSPTTSTDPPPSTPPTVPIPNPFSATPYTGGYAGDPGLRNPNLYQSFPTGTPPANSTSAVPPTFVAPPAIPVRRLFQPPDANQTTNPQSNAGVAGDPYINTVAPLTAPTATGALPVAKTVNDGFVNLFWTTNTPIPTGVPNPYLGSGVSGVTTIDNRQHPYFRSELLQKAMNLTTVRTHQYAVWITVGFFEVTRQGNLLMIQSGNPILAFDLLGPELGASTGQTTRYRGFFLVDRLKLYGFDDTTPGSFRPAVVYRQTIE